MNESATQTGMRTLFDAQRRSFEQNRSPTLAQRRAHLQALDDMLCQHMDELAQAIHDDFGGRSPDETFLIEMVPTLEGVRHARRRVGRWMKPKRAGVSRVFLPATAAVVPQPLGVVGIIVPWNYPILLAIGPLVAALAAGNRVMLKVSEHTPKTAEVMALVLGKYFPQDHVAVVNGDAVLAQAFSSLPFDHLLFTGSTAVGRQVMRSAAEQLTPVTLELGGKSPVIISPDYSMDRAAERILFGKCLNAGQSCTAPDYVLVPHEQVDAFVLAARLQVARLYPNASSNVDYTSVANDRQHRRLQDCLADALAHGAQAVELGESRGGGIEGPRKMPPTLLLNVNDDMRVMQEEIFGPLLPVVGYHSLSDAIAFVNDRPRPLALYFFGNNRRDKERVTAETISGGVAINDTMYQVAQHNLPFGGVGPSGMGHYHGHYGFETFSKLKGVLHQSFVSGARLTQPPYGTLFRLLKRVILFIA